eukprot:664537-Amphidinium_carterae.1
MYEIPVGVSVGCGVLTESEGEEGHRIVGRSTDRIPLQSSSPTSAGIPILQPALDSDLLTGSS